MKFKSIRLTATGASAMIFSRSRSRKSKSGLLSGGFYLPVCAALLSLAIHHPAQAQTFTVLYSFTGQGASPAAGVVGDNAGNFYGTTEFGGNAACALGCGTVFRANAVGKQKLLYRFSGKADGAYPYSGVSRDAQGNLYGTTLYGGNTSCGGGCGTIFKIDISGKMSTLYSFTGPPDGAVPQSGLVRDANGNLYGTTYNGGDAACDNGIGCGTVYKVDAVGQETVLYTFTGGTDGRFPSAGLLRDAAGNLWGTTSAGGTARGGTIFQLDNTGKQVVLHSFTGSPDGSSPSAGLLRVGSNLYGTTATGGTTGTGTIFRSDIRGNEIVLYSFLAGADGANPSSGLIADGEGNLYGTAANGGVFEFGTVFRLDKTGKLTVLHSFTGGADGANPSGNLTRDTAGNLYGTTQTRGSFGFGTIFKIAP